MGDWIDITRVLKDGMTGWPGDPPFRLRPVADIGRDGVTVTEICTSAHIGTHLDTPLHCQAGGADAAQIPLRQLCGSAVVISLPGVEEVTVADLQSADVRPGDRVLVRVQGIAGTGSQVAGGTGCGGTGGTAISIEAARWLVHRGAVLLGIDSPSPDRPDATGLPVHRLLLEAGVVILENLVLADVSPGRYELVALPLPIQGCEASPVRAMIRGEGQGVVGEG